MSAPLLGNLFLHLVLDEWYVHTVKPRLHGRSVLVRYADDFVLGCELEADARRIMAVLPKRFARFGLTIHPQKTALVAFGKPTARAAVRQGTGTFEFLGFTHYWARSRQGYWVIKRRTAKKRLRRTLTARWQWCRRIVTARWRSNTRNCVRNCGGTISTMASAAITAS